VSSLPNNDIVGAKAHFRSWEWQLGTRSVTSFNGSTMNLSAMGSAGNYYDDTPPGNFYLEGKLWMLDSAGEWAWIGGKLYVWMPDGTNPGARVLAASNVNAVNANNSSNVTLDGVRIVGGNAGINGSGASVLKVLNSEVAYSTDAMNIGDTDRANVDNTDVIGAVRTGITGGWWSTNATVNNSRVVNGNMVGMHKGSDGAIFFGDGSDATITNNMVTNSGKTGIGTYHTQRAIVRNNTIDGACIIHSDCGGIYTFARDQQPLNTRIENNNISNVNGAVIGPWGPLRFAIYLDDHSNGVTVTGNTVTNSNQGMLIHGGFNNTISGNTFSGNVERHVWFSDSAMGAGSMYNNVFSNNTFFGPVLAYSFYSEYGSNVASWASFSGNIYQNYGGNPVGDPPYLSY
jgi:parallel beta-helix repeat protein